MNGKEIRTIKEDVCTELNKTSVRYDLTDVSFDIEPKGLVMAGLSECLKDLDKNDAQLSDYEIIITNIRIEFKKI